MTTTVTSPIRVHHDLKAKLDRFKEHPRETVNDVLARLIVEHEKRVKRGEKRRQAS